jgi:hypothetical protein
MQLDLDDDLKMLDASGEIYKLLIPGLTAEAEVRHGRVYVSSLHINGRPFPARGGKIDAFEAEFAARIIAHVQMDWDSHIRKKWKEDAQNRETAAQHDAMQFQLADVA